MKREDESRRESGSDGETMSAQHEVLDQWEVTGSLYEGVACHEDVLDAERLIGRLRAAGPNSLAGLRWVAQRGRFSWCLKRQLGASPGPIPPLLDEDSLPRRMPGIPRSFDALEWVAVARAPLTPSAHPLWHSFTLNPRVQESHVLFRGHFPRSGRADEGYLTPALMLRRDTHGRTLNDFVAEGRVALHQELTSLGVTFTQLAALPESLVEAVLTVIAADPSGRIRSKLDSNPAFLGALGLMLGDRPDAWVERGHFAPPLEAIQRGVKDRDVLAIAHELMQERDAARDTIEVLGRGDLRGHSSALVYAKVIAQRPIPLHLASEMWRFGFPPSWIPRHEEHRIDWVAAHKTLESSKGTRRVNPRDRRYLARYGATVQTVFKDMHELNDILYRLGRDRGTTGTRGLLAPRTLRVHERTWPLAALEGVDAAVELEGLRVQPLLSTRAVRDAGRRLRNCMSALERRDLFLACKGFKYFFEVSWSGGSAMSSIELPGTLPDSICALGPGNADLPEDVEARIRRVLLDALERAYPRAKTAKDEGPSSEETAAPASGLEAANVASDSNDGPGSPLQEGGHPRSRPSDPQAGARPDVHQ